MYKVMDNHVNKSVESYNKLLDKKTFIFPTLV